MRFDFGRNWAKFSRNALTADRVAQAQADFAELFEGVANLVCSTFPRQAVDLAQRQGRKVDRIREWSPA